MHRIAIVTSHPIQYQAPWFRALSAVSDVTTFFCHRQDAAGQAAAGFGQAFEWDVPLLDGYRFEFLENVSRTPGVDRFAGCDTPGVRERLAAGRFEACIVNGWYLKSYLQAIRACWSLGLPVLVRGDSHRKGEGLTPKAVAKYFPYRWMLGRIDAHLYVGQANYAYLRHYGVHRDRLFFTPHFVDTDRFREAASRARQDGTADALRASFGASPDTSVFLFAGKLLGGKRADDFVRAIARLRLDGEDVRGVIVGSGPEEARLRELAGTDRASIKFAGFRNQREIPAWYAAADCLVVPSARETWGLVVNEAMAAGVPAIVSDAVGCAEDLIDEGRTGFTYPAGSTHLLAARMREMRGMLSARREDVLVAVAAKIDAYSCDAAVAGTLEAVAFVTSRRAPAAVRHEQRAHVQAK